MMNNKTLKHITYKSNDLENNCWTTMREHPIYERLLKKSLKMKKYCYESAKVRSWIFRKNQTSSVIGKENLINKFRKKTKTIHDKNGKTHYGAFVRKLNRPVWKIRSSNTDISSENRKYLS